MSINTVKQTATSTSEFAAPLPAGTYLVGDPCYAFDNNGPDYWSEWLESAWTDVDPNRVQLLDGTVQGLRIAASSTEHGDGYYDDQDGFGYPVDAGLLGAVDIRFLEVLYPDRHGKSHEELETLLSMRVVEFDRPFHVSYEDGVVSIGHVDINTGDEGVDDEDDDENED